MKTQILARTVVSLGSLLALAAVAGAGQKWW